MAINTTIALQNTAEDLFRNKLEAGVPMKLAAVAITTDATLTELFFERLASYPVAGRVQLTSTTGLCITVPVGGVVDIYGRIYATFSDETALKNQCYNYNTAQSFRRTAAGTVAIVGTAVAPTLSDAAANAFGNGTAAACTPSFVADDTAKAVAVKVTGVAATVISWRADLEVRFLPFHPSIAA
jgi:hypothetical protein